MMRLLPLLLVLVAAFAAPLPVSTAAWAQPPGGETEAPAAKLERWDAEAARIQERLDAGEIPSAELDRMRATLEAQRAAIPGAVSAAESELQPMLDQREALGPAPEDPREEAAEVIAERERLRDRIAEIEAWLKLLSQADARAASLLSSIAEMRRKNFTRQLLTRGPSPLEPGVAGRALASLTSAAAAIAGESAERLAETDADLSLLLRIGLPLVVIGAALYLAVGVRRALLQRLLSSPEPEDPGRRRVLVGIAVTLVRLFLPAIAVVLAFLAVWNSGFLGRGGQTVLRGLAWTALVVIGAYGLGGAFYSPRAPRLGLSYLPEAEAASAHRWLMALAAVVGLDRALVVQGEIIGLAIEALSLANAVLIALGGVAVWGYVRHLREPASAAVPGTAGTEADEEEGHEDRREASVGPLVVRVLQVVARAVAVLAPALALAGYFAASRFVFYPVVFSGAVIGVAVLLYHAVREVVDRVVLPHEGEESGAPSRVRLIPVVVAFLLICGTVPVLALIWGASVADLASAWRAFEAGFKVGEVTISPLDFFSFLLVFSVGYVLTRIVQGVLRRSVLPVTRLDAGGRAAVSAMVFYVGVFFAALIAISATGVDLSNLALVAGALSVGIGFGLQNVVNNFVSGLILLLERPIKAGDWVEIASGMGYVKQINVRSTEIETFDRASLIVPNSELISASVTNWTHTNLQGRVIVPIHVAYGTDPRKVEQVLTEIATAHPMLLRRPPPYVLFRRFGPDALEFEIRGILRDVNWILNVHSEINFEIARRFAEEGIRISYPQRDLHLRNTDEVASAIGEALRGDGGAAPGAPESGPPESATPESATPESATPRSATPRRRPPQPPARDDGDGDADI
ncbi:MAG TPA: DUF3772 domain-containing protein [Thermohalobaculum sp.]|nr:DUF3772 domain-containing protein [Thermohalobaculum sp.]